MEQGLECEVEQGLECEVEQGLECEVEQGLECEVEQGLECEVEQGLECEVEQGLECEVLVITPAHLSILLKKLALALMTVVPTFIRVKHHTRLASSDCC